MDKKILMIIVMGIIILVGLFCFLIPKYNLWQQDKGIESAIKSCQVPFIFNNQTINITAVDCLRQNG